MQCNARAGARNNNVTTRQQSNYTRQQYCRQITLLSMLSSISRRSLDQPMISGSADDLWISRRSLDQPTISESADDLKNSKKGLDLAHRPKCRSNTNTARTKSSRMSGVNTVSQHLMFTLQCDKTDPLHICIFL